MSCSPTLTSCNLTLSRTTTALHLLEIAELYIHAFPAEERRSLLHLAEDIHRPEARFWTLRLNDNLVGMLHAWELPNVVFGEHFATLPNVRGQGIGAAALRILKSSTQKPILLEVEPPCDEFSHRRIAFYERLGFHIVETEYCQPQYSPDLPSVPLYIMSSHPDMDLATLRLAIKEIHTIVYARHAEGY